MVVEGLFGLPRWLIVGVGLGAACSLVAAALFLVTGRLFPSHGAHGPGDAGETRRRTELREYLDAVGERYAEDHPVEGHRVAFYLPERDVAVTFDARAYYAIERSGTDAVLVEHEMPGVQLGHRLPFDVPDVDFGPAARATPDGGGPPADAFAELGLPTTATPDEVERAYRRRAKETHPDQGGDEEAFKRVTEAYATAKEHVR